MGVICNNDNETTNKNGNIIKGEIRGKKGKNKRRSKTPEPNIYDQSSNTDDDISFVKRKSNSKEKYITPEEHNQIVHSLLQENESLKKENETLKKENENLKTQIMQIKNIYNANIINNGFGNIQNNIMMNNGGFNNNPVFINKNAIRFVFQSGRQDLNIDANNLTKMSEVLSELKTQIPDLKEPTLFLYNGINISGDYLVQNLDKTIPIIVMNN